MKKNAFALTQNLKKRFMVAITALFFVSALSGCELTGSCGFGDDVKPDILPCGTLVTVTSAGCATGAFQSYWLQLENGELLQPFENRTDITAIEPGQRYLIGYETMRRDKRYDGQVICLALPPSGTPVRLLCMIPEESTPDSQLPK